MTADMIHDYATSILSRHKIEWKLGYNWAYRFIKRLPDNCLYTKGPGAKAKGRI
ncbi:Pogo transposase / Cenp-B / PDC2, DNA-binding HTH domain [Penicillium roqueforti FM164]|uniref:Pogo transposase / Cenp-B / PDC2, DNA-binding HTH domain n=1 Tax=Penicillium roqueforti (strain FM164) TaxID=1365484 RepID=W6QH15_PENRF|nr:Pogo transposase / Cenp-B / PDC2, DNA-binding HTH domain [Penicillium roqueforti FM164]